MRQFTSTMNDKENKISGDERVQQKKQPPNPEVWQAFFRFAPY